MTDTNRWDNISWTVAENYTLSWNELLFPSLDFYSSALRGAVEKYYSTQTMEEFLRRFALKQNNAKELLTIAQILLEELVSTPLLKQRPGLWEQRDKSIQTFYDTLPSRGLELATELKLAYYQRKKNKVPVAAPLTLQLVEDILRFCPQKNDTTEVIQFLQHLYDKYFHVSSTLPPDEKKTYETFVQKKKIDVPHIQQTSSQPLLAEEELEKFNIGSAEFTEVEQEDSDKSRREEDVKTAALPRNDIYHITQKHYGKEVFPRYKVQQWEKEISTGIHQDIHLYFAGGEFAEENSYYAARVEDNFSENMEYYNNNHLTYERGIRKLMVTIQNALLEENENSPVRSNTGQLIAKDLWKYSYLGEDRIFQKVQKWETKDLYVDILLDSSASQDSRKSQVATECYIIASALTRLHIKTRVISFNNFYNYLVLKIYRDYLDSPVKNTEIFRYTPSGSNRDGMAIKLLRHQMEQHRDQRRIIIVLSDGKPNDEIHLNIVGTQDIDGQDYVEETALHDTAKEVLMTKLKDIHIFGVFMGEEEDIGKVKKIYGTDFAYITDVRRFHDVVGIFLKTFAQKMDN